MQTVFNWLQNTGPGKLNCLAIAIECPQSLLEKQVRAKGLSREVDQNGSLNWLNGDPTEDRLACLEAGMNDFVATPVEPENLFASVVKWLDEH